MDFFICFSSHVMAKEKLTPLEYNSNAVFFGLVVRQNKTTIAKEFIKKYFTYFTVPS